MMELPIIVEWVRSFKGGFCLISANLNPYSERYSEALEEEIQPYISKKYNTFTITANVDDDAGMQGGQYIFMGDFVKHPKFGDQFKSDFFYKDVPATEEGLQIFLMTLPNIKEARSKSIVAKFGVEGTLNILDNDIYKLTEVNGITTQRIPAIEKAWKSEKCLRELYEFFISRGMAPALAKTSYKRWGKDAQSIIETNPYKLTELHGVGFVMADQEAHKIMEVISNEFRTTACMEYVLQEFTHKNSNLCIPYKHLKECVLSVIGKCDIGLGKTTDLKLYLSLIPKCFKSNLDKFTMVKDLENDVVYAYLRHIWDKEKFVAKNLFERSLADSKNSELDDLEVLLERLTTVISNTKINLDDSQTEAILSAFRHKITVIIGPAGSGKSTICRYIVELAQEKRMTVRLMSPTGKAAQVLETKTGSPASTIHRGLKMKPGEDVPRGTIDEDILLIDEISMCGVDTMYAMLKAMENNIYGNIVFVGDKNQLPSVSPGNFLSDIIESGVANVVTLNKIHRQSEDSYISIIANNISNGKIVEVPDEASDIVWHDLSVDSLHEEILEFITNYVKRGNEIDNLQVMSPMKKGPCGVYKLNEVIQERMSELNGTEYGKTEECMARPFGKFYRGDRVIQIENNYDKMIFNGDMGTVVDFGEKIVDPLATDKAEKFVVVSFYGDEIDFYGDEIDQLQLAWCITVHKFQGSQAPNIIFVMAKEAQIMMSKELVYTAFTRAEKTLDVFGHADMLRIAPTFSVIKKRYTMFPRIVASYRKNKKILQVLERS